VNKYNILPLIITILLVIPLSIFGQNRFSATTERTKIAMGEQAVVVATLVTNRQVQNLTIPRVAATNGFSLLKTDSRQSSSSSIQIINGQASQKNEITTQFYYFLAPQQTGTFTFPALSLTIDGQDLSTDPITFSVTNEPVSNPDIKSFLILSAKSLYPGEQSLLTFKIAQRAQTAGQTEIRNGFNGALEKIDQALGKEFALTRLFTNQVASGSERIDGEMYNVFSLRFLLFPVSTGTFKIPAVPFEFQELRRASRRRGVDPFFDDFFGGDIFGGGVQAVAKTVFTAPFTIDVKQLPPAPAGFSGAVGTFAITATADPVSVPSGESVTLKVLFKGNTRPGNMPDIAIPKADTYELFTPEKQVAVDTGESGIATRKTYKYLLIPKEEGTVTIPPVSFLYFDPVTESYKTAASEPITLSVTKGNDGKKEQTRYLTQEEIREVGRDIRYIKTNVALKHQTRYAYREPIFFLLFPLPFIFCILSLLYRFQATRRDRTMALQVRNKALSVALKQIAALKKQAQSLKPAEFLGRIAATIETYISQKFGFAATGRTLDELKKELSHTAADQKIIDDLATFIQQIDHYRFGGAALDDASRISITGKAETFLVGLEKSAKKEKRDMKKAIALVIGIIGAANAFSAPVEHWFEQANRMYSEGLFDSAAATYEKILESGIENSAVYYNYGNALYRMKKLGAARLAYERAALLNPNDPDIATNIRFVESNIVDRVPEPQRGFLDAVVWKLHTLFTLKTQLWIVFILLCGIAFAIAVSLFTSRNIRLWLIYLSALLGLLVVAMGSSAGYKIYSSEKIAYAILLTQSIDAKNEPNGSTILFTAHEGTKFRIRKTIDDWALVSLPNGVSGWVEKKALGKI
jgi:tetratricopeptide (TPR) repeat protein